MEIEKYRYIVASDLDGTLLTHGEQLSGENKKAIKEMAELGVVFAPCSGRTFMEMPAVVRENPDIRYYICGDGALVYDKQTGERVVDLGMKTDEARVVLDLLDEYGYKFMNYDDFVFYFTLRAVMAFVVSAGIMNLRLQY